MGNTEGTRHLFSKNLCYFNLQNSINCMINEGFTGYKVNILGT